MPPARRVARKKMRQPKRALLVARAGGPGGAYAIPGKGTVTRSPSGKAKNYEGQGPAPAGTKKVAEKDYTEVPTTTVTTSPSGAREVSTSGFASQQAAKRARRAQKRSERRVRRIVRETRPEPREAPQSPKPYVAPKPVPTQPLKPETFKGHKTAGEPTRTELQKAADAGTLKVNRKGFATTPKVRQVGGELRRLQAAARSSNAPLPGLDREQTKVARTVLRRGVKAKATRKEKLASLEAGLQESTLRNLDYGDADSQGWRQERTSIYGTGPTGARNVKASADRFFEESITDANRGAGMGPGELAQAIQASAYPEAYEPHRPQAEQILQAFNKGGLKPGQRKQLRKVTKEAKALGLKTPKESSTGKLKGPFDGSRSMVRRILGAKVRGDKEEGHSPTGDHDPSQPNAYAQDIGSAGANPAEGEPPYSQATLNRMVKNIRRMGAKVPKLTLGADNWEGTIKGYRIQILTIEHGSGPHIHVGARWSGESTGGAYSEGGVVYGGSDVASYAQATGQSVDAVYQKLQKNQLTGMQILQRLKRLGVGAGMTAPEQRATGRASTSTLQALEEKYL